MVAHSIYRHALNPGSSQTNIPDYHQLQSASCQAIDGVDPGSVGSLRFVTPWCLPACEVAMEAGSTTKIQV